MFLICSLRLGVKATDAPIEADVFYYQIRGDLDDPKRYRWLVGKLN